VRSSLLTAAALGAALTPLNSTMVAVALPALGATFETPSATVTLLVVTGYLVATLVFSMPAGSVADRVGYSRALTAGRWIFGMGALAGALAPSILVVLAGRLLMAAGGALIVPTAMALLRVGIPVERRPRAFGAMGAVMGGAAAIGPALGAWLVAELGWRSLFAVNVPLLLASWILQPAVAAAPSSEARAHPFDWIGSILIGAALILATFSTRAGAPAAYWLAGAGAIAFAALIVHERRAPAPVLNLDLFRRRGFVAGAGVIATQNLAMYSLLVLIPFLFGGESAPGGSSRLGLAIIAMTATMAAVSPAGGRLAESLGGRPVVAAGGAVAAVGVASLGSLPATAPVLEIAPRLFIVGLGLGLSTGPANAAAISAVPPQQSAVASATVSMLRYVGAIAGTVILGFVVVGESGAGGRQRVAMFTGALAGSALLGLMLRPYGERPGS
jgi:MFS family permease